MDIIGGVFFHAAGASSAALCYTPQKKVMRWSWQTYWLAQAAVCWLLLPVIIAWVTIPHLIQVLSEAPTASMWKSFVLGMAYGIGGTAFGVAIRYVGFSLTYAISVGISCVLGTLLPPLLKGELSGIIHNNGSGWIITGIAMGVLGIALCGIAGRYKEQDLSQKQSTALFNLSKGLPLCLLAGLLSAVYGFALDQGQPLADVAAKYGAGNFQGNVIYIFSNSGAFLSTLIYCLYLHSKQKTFAEYRKLQASEKSTQLSFNFMMAAVTGILWYGQFFFYGLGHVRMGDFKFTGWAIHMIMLVLFSSLAGIIMKEWIAVKGRTRIALLSALAILIIAVLVLTYGNYLGNITG